MIFDLVLLAMSKLRLKPDQPITYYHVMTRTAQKSFLMEDATFKEQVARIIHDFAGIYYVEIVGWCLMDNHYHLAVKVLKPQQDNDDLERRFNLLQGHLKQPKKWRKWLDPEIYYRRFTDLSKYMWEINRRIAIAFNTKHKTWGHFWGARFKSKVVEDQAALLRVLAYIEQNPVRAGLVELPSLYPHCSAGRIKQALVLGQRTKAPGVDWLADLWEEDRAQAYLTWTDRLAQLIHHPKIAAARNDTSSILPQIAYSELEKTCAEIRAGTPSDWSTAGYGSPEFVNELKGWQKAKSNQHAPNRRRSVVV